MSHRYHPQAYDHGHAPHHPQPHGHQPHPHGPSHGYQPHPHMAYGPPPIISQPNIVDQKQDTNVVVNANAGAGGMGDGIAPGTKRGWSTNLCACLEDCECIIAAFFPICYTAAVSSRMMESILLPFCVPQALMLMRIAVREENHIRGSICEDCVTTTFCPLLSLCQLKRELDNIGSGKIRGV